MKNKKGFTLIELLAVIVILAILALIAIPIVIQIIKDSRENSYKRSIEAYGRNVENAMASWQTENDSEAPTQLSSYDIKMSGNKVKCDDDTITITEDSGIVLHMCYIIDGKGNRKSDLYKYENRKATKEGEQEENGSSNSSSSYKEYNVGDEIKVNGEGYHVIANSDSKQDYVVALKDKELTEDEINDNKLGNDGINHVNRYTIDDVGVSKSYNGYGVLAYYSSPSCGFDSSSNSYDESGCESEDANNYDNSDIKFIVDSWAKNRIGEKALKEINGYKARLITINELENNLECSNGCVNSQFDWTYKINGSYGAYMYWTMTKWDNNYTIVRHVDMGGWTNGSSVYDNANGAVRPVINLRKEYIK